MKLIRVSEYDIAFLRSFFQPFHFAIAVEALLEGSSYGAIWMDNLSHPTLVVLWDFADGIYIMSLERNKEQLKALKFLLQEEIIPEAEKRSDAPVFVIYILPEYDENEIRALFDSKWHVSKENASFYEFPLVELPSKKQVYELPSSLEGNLMDMDLFQDLSIRYIEVLREEIESEWDSIESFLACIFGYYIRDLDNNSLASWAIGGKIAKSCGEFEIHPLEQYQRQGLGQFAAQELIEHALERGLVSHWYCFQHNVPSVNLAERLGFQKMRDFEVFVIKKQ
jgi:RimJ/RimL family protein N-acetyltransferase